MRRNRIPNVLAVALSFALLGIWSAPLFAAEENEILQERYRVREVGHESLSALYEIQPSARHAIEHSAGYGVFSIFGIKIFFVEHTNHFQDFLLRASKACFLSLKPVFFRGNSASALSNLSGHYE